MNENHNYASTSGVLSIVSGVLGILGGLTCAGVGVFFYFMSKGLVDFAEDQLPPEFTWIVIAVYGAIGLILCLMGILAIVGGAFAIRKVHWGWALAGAISGAAVFFFTGIAAVVLVSLGKGEFSTAKAPVPTGPPA